jgi:predicted transcriptional regulator
MAEIVSASEGLINPAYDKFLDGHPTRRELQKAFTKMGENDANLYAAIDTQALVGNFLCEKLGVTRAELDAYVARKAEEVKAMHEAQEKAQRENTLQGQVMDVVPN